MEEIANEWNGLSEEERRRWQQPVRAQSPPVPVGPAIPRPVVEATSGVAVWPKCGDDFYPLRCAVLGDLPAQVGTLSKEWHDRVGDEVLTASRRLDAGPVRCLCEGQYGRGRCGNTLPAADKTALAAARGRIRQWCHLRRAKPCKCDGVWESLGLLYVGPRQAPPASADAFPPGYMALLLYAELSPLALVACVQRSMPPKPGDVVRLKLSMETLASDVQLARTGHVRCRVLFRSYRFFAFTDVGREHRRKRLGKGRGARGMCRGGGHGQGPHYGNITLLPGVPCHVTVLGQASNYIRSKLTHRHEMPDGTHCAAVL